MIYIDPGALAAMAVLYVVATVFGKQCFYRKTPAKPTRGNC
jgi:hypothetical protein